ncbi:MAG: trk system potassium uptake protein TrkA [Puniceicoccaceae bacterium 5H]|nr:MAG: trk system potassium uptake protein TrkA [Puniceicoccaceae bacterium 5H]
MKIAVIGLGQFGFQLALALAEEKHEVVAIDVEEKTVDAIKDQVAHAVIADAQDAKVLDELGLTDFDRVCVAIGEDFAASLLITGHLQELGVEHIYCRAVNPVHERLLNLMKVEHIVQAELLAARQLAKRMGIRGATRHFDLSKDFGIVELHVPDFLIGKNLVESDLRRRFSVNLVTVKRQKGDSHEVIGVPPPELVFQEGDELVVFGTEPAIKGFSSRKEF